MDFDEVVKKRKMIREYQQQIAELVGFKSHKL
jgi:hypothetical protein